MRQGARVCTQPGHSGRPQRLHVLWKIRHHPGRQHRPPSLQDIGHLPQERRQAARFTAKEGDDPHHGEREEEHDPQGEDSDCGELALLLTDADHLQTGGQDVHQFVDEESCEERRQ